jgi:hypothetical protein
VIRLPKITRIVKENDDGTGRSPLSSDYDLVELQTPVRPEI